MRKCVAQGEWALHTIIGLFCQRLDWLKLNSSILAFHMRSMEWNVRYLPVEYVFQVLISLDFQKFNTWWSMMILRYSNLPLILSFLFKQEWRKEDTKEIKEMSTIHALLTVPYHILWHSFCLQLDMVHEVKDQVMKAEPNQTRQLFHSQLQILLSSLASERGWSLHSLVQQMAKNRIAQSKKEAWGSE